MSKQSEHGGKEPERDVAGNIVARQSDEGGGDETRETDDDRREQRLSQEAILNETPSPFVVAWVPRIASALDRPTTATALDVAMGHGRHALLLARAGFRTFGVDLNLASVRDAASRARAEGLTLLAWSADLRAVPLPDARFDLILVTRFLQRDLVPVIRRAVKPAGFVVYETFTVKQRQLGFGPRSPEHLLEPGELLKRFDGFEVLSYEELDAPEAVARLVARRPQRN